MRVLAICIDPTTVEFMRLSGIAVDEDDAFDADTAGLWVANGYDAVIADLDRSDAGIYAGRLLRERKAEAPFIGIARDTLGQAMSDRRALFLENGGDDLLRGPPNPRELCAVLRALTRRQQGVLLDVVEYRKDSARLKVNFTTRRVTVDGVEIRLTVKQIGLLLCLASAPGRTFSKELILSNLYVDGVDNEPEMKVIDVFVCKIRATLKEVNPDAEKFIETDWGRGYHFAHDRAPVEVGEARQVA